MITRSDSNYTKLYRYLTLKFSNREGAFDNPQCPTINVYRHIKKCNNNNFNA